MQLRKCIYPSYIVTSPTYLHFRFHRFDRVHNCNNQTFEWEPEVWCHLHTTPWLRLGIHEMTHIPHHLSFHRHRTTLPDDVDALRLYLQMAVYSRSRDYKGVLVSESVLRSVSYLFLLLARYSEIGQFLKGFDNYPCERSLLSPQSSKIPPLYFPTVGVGARALPSQRVMPIQTSKYCTISTKCSRGVTCDLRCSLEQVFIADKSVQI